MTATNATPLLEVNGLAKHFPVATGVLQRTGSWIKAVDGVDLVVRRGETFGLVGESGCGKSTLGRLIVRLLEPTAGSIRFEGQEMAHLDDAALLPFRQSVQIVFQDPYSALNPRMRVGRLVGEPLRIHKHLSGSALQAEVQRLLDAVGLPGSAAEKFPHEF